MTCGGVRSWVQMISPGGHIWLLWVCVGKWFVLWDNFKVLWVSSRIGSFILWTQIECKSWMLSASNRLLGIGVGCNDQKKNRALHEEKTLFCLLRFVIHDQELITSPGGVEPAPEQQQIQESGKEQKNNTRDSNVVPHRSTNLARSCLTSLSRREAVLSWLYGRSCLQHTHRHTHTHAYTTLNASFPPKNEKKIQEH